jgi:hypothetical protein
MAWYIKEELHHSRHLIAADYTGTGPMSEYPDSPSNPCQSTHFDDSWLSNNIDVIAWNNYSAGLNRWEKMSDHEYYPNVQSNGLLCLGPMQVGNYTSLWKPVINPEVGMDACMSIDHTGFVKDLLVGPFSGHASSGMSWDEWGSSQYWYMFQEVSEFFRDYVLNEVDLGNEEWTPDHEYSEPDQNSSDCEFAEAIFLFNGNSSNPKYIGVILNRSWNNRSVWNCGGGNDTFIGPNEPLQQCEVVGWIESELFLHNAGLHQITIRYFDPYTKNIVNEENRWSNGFRLGLENYPLMYDGTNNHQPFYFFEAFIQGSEFNQSQSKNETLSALHSNAKKDEKPTTPAEIITSTPLEMLKEKSQSHFTIFPSPSDNMIVLNSDKNIIGHEVLIYSIEGDMIQRKCVTSTTELFDITSLAIGTYFMICPDFHYRTYFIKK